MMPETLAAEREQVGLTVDPQPGRRWNLLNSDAFARYSQLAKCESTIAG